MSPRCCTACDGRGKRVIARPGALIDRRGNVATRTLICGHCDGTGVEPFPGLGLSACTCGEAWSGHPNPHAINCPRHVQ